MRKKILRITLIIGLLFITISSMGFLSKQHNHALAEDFDISKSSELNTVQETVFSMFGKTIQSMTNLRFSNDEIRFVLLNFSEGGYGVFLKDTFEMLEYSPSGHKDIPTNLTSYYLAPNCFCIKDENYFRDIKSNQVLSIEQNNELSFFSKFSSQKNILNHSFYSDCCFETDQTINMRNSNPPYDDNNRIYVDYSCGKFIDNYYYFQNLPSHGENIHGTCGSTAAQLLLSYHNYYTDRSIIDAEYLNTDNPYNCNDPLDYSSNVLGTNDDYYEYVIGKIEPNALNCHHDLNNTSCIHNGANYLQVRNGLTSIFNDSSCSSFSVNADISLLSPVSSNIITDEIDNNRPIIISLYSGTLNHWAVAYGYQNYSYPNGGNTYFGYVTHFGWFNDYGESNERIWVNSAWCDGYVKIQSTHTHNYVNNSTINSEMVCSECGHRNIRFLYETTTNNTQKITGVHEDVNNIYYCPVHVPTIIDGKYVTEIDSSFKNNCKDGWRNIILPNTITYIGNTAFSGCTYLHNIKIVSSINLTSFPDQALSYSNYYYTEHCLNVNLVPDTVYTLSFDYTNLTSTGDLTDVFTSLGVGENSFTTDLPFVKYFSDTSGKLAMRFIPTYTQLSTSNKLWCRFIRTSTPQTVSLSIENVILEKGVTDIAINAFRECQHLATHGLLYEPISGNAKSVSQGTMDSCVLFIPKWIYNSPNYITTIKANGFANNKNIKWVFTQDGLTTIGNRAFQFCSNLMSVDLEQTQVTSIGDYAFDICSRYSDPNHVHNPHSYLYGRCMMDDFTFPSDGTLTTIGEGAFIRNGVPAYFQIPDTVTNIGDYAFMNMSVTGFRLPNNLTSIGTGVFEECGNIYLNNFDINITSIGEDAFLGTGLINVDHLSTSVTTVHSYAFCGTNFASNFTFKANHSLTTIETYGFANSNIERIVLPSSISTIGSNAFYGCDTLTIYTSYSSKPSGWNNNWNSSNRPVFWNCNLSNDKSYVISFSKSASNPSNTGATNGISDPYRSGYTFGGWYTTSNFSGTKYTSSTLSSAPNGTLYAKWTEQSCIAEGTLITLADGSQVSVENLTGNEYLLVWNMLTGQYDSAPILFIDNDSSAAYEIINLTFSDGTTVEVIYEHAFFDITLGKYVFLRNDAYQYIGHYFNKQSTNQSWVTVQLIDVDIYTSVTTAWSPVTYGHLCYYVNGILSMPGATEGLINIFDVDTTLMKYDPVQMAADIQTYGLYTYAEFNAIIPLPEYVFNAFNGQYLKVSIGKGLITLEEIVILLERYAIFFS